MLSVIIIIGLVAAALVMLPLHFNTSYIPGPIDEATRLETALTKTATYAGTTLNLGAGYTPGGPGQAFGVVVQATAVDRTDVNETYAFKLQESADGVTWTDASQSVSTVIATTFSIPCFVSQPYVRLSATLAGTTPSITYSAWLVPIQ